MIENDFERRRIEEGEVSRSAKDRNREELQEYEKEGKGVEESNG